MIEFELYRKLSSNAYAYVRHPLLHLGDDIISVLLAPAPMKEDLTNSSRLEHGSRVKRIMYMGARSLTLTFVIQGTSKANHKENYEFLLKYLMSEEFCIKIPKISNKIYFLAYQSSQSYSRSTSGLVSKLAVKAMEYNPNKTAFSGFITFYEDMFPTDFPTS